MEEKKTLRYSHTYLLTAGECNCEGVMPVTLVAARAIEVATEHANMLGIGYATLSKRGIGWVLSRISVEMKRWPGINEHYTVSTWIEGWTRLYSDRVFEIADADGNIIGHVRTVWVAIDMVKRSVADLTGIASDDLVWRDGVCPLPKQRRIPTVPVDRATTVSDYTFRYCDLDFNRHVNSVRYIEHILNLWTPGHYANFALQRFEIAYVHECLFGETVTMAALETAGDVPEAVVDMTRRGERVIAAHLTFSPRDCYSNR